MTEQEMRELDAWVAEHGLGIDVKRDANGEPYIPIFGKPIGMIMRYSEKPDAFAQVKREIERRGWCWMAFGSANQLQFAVFIEDGTTGGCSGAETEELAGCLAFKAAVEATNGESTH